MMIRWGAAATMRPLLTMALVSFTAVGCAALAASEALPSSLAVPDAFKSKDTWQQSSMIPLDLSLGEVKTQGEISVSSMIQQQSKSAGTVMFAVRRAG